MGQIGGLKSVVNRNSDLDRADDNGSSMKQTYLRTWYGMA